MNLFDVQVKDLIRDKRHGIRDADFGDPTAWQMLPGDDDPEYREEVVISDSSLPDADKALLLTCMMTRT